MYACSLYATEQINEQQFEDMIQRYRQLMSQRETHKIMDMGTPVKKLGPPRKL